MCKALKEEYKNTTEYGDLSEVVRKHYGLDLISGPWSRARNVLKNPSSVDAVYSESLGIVRIDKLKRKISDFSSEGFGREKLYNFARRFSRLSEYRITTFWITVAVCRLAEVQNSGKIRSPALLKNTLEDVCSNLQYTRDSLQRCVDTLIYLAKGNDPVQIKDDAHRLRNQLLRPNGEPDWTKLHIKRSGERNMEDAVKWGIIVAGGLAIIGLSYLWFKNREKKVLKEPRVKKSHASPKEPATERQRLLTMILPSSEIANLRTTGKLDAADAEQLFKSAAYFGLFDLKEGKMVENQLDLNDDASDINSSSSDVYISLRFIDHESMDGEDYFSIKRGIRRIKRGFTVRKVREVNSQRAYDRLQLA